MRYALRNQPVGKTHSGPWWYYESHRTKWNQPGERPKRQRKRTSQAYVPTLGDRLVIPVVGVVVVASVLGISRVERLHSQRSSAVLVDHLERSESLFGSEELGSDDHGDG
jgi:hypothetical protein